MQRHSKRIAFSMESLEERKVMDVGIGLDLASGVLSITGDASNDYVQISQPSANQVRVETLYGTEFNDGGNVRVFNASQVNHLDIQLGGGYNTLWVNSISNVDSMFSNSLGQSQRTNVYLNGADFSGNVAIYGTEQSENIQVRNSDIGSLDLWGAGGNNNIWVDNVSTQGVMSIGTADGNDIVTVEDSDVGQTSGSSYRPLNIWTSHGRDQVSVIRTEVNDHMSVNLGDGPIGNHQRQTLTVTDTTTAESMLLQSQGQSGAFITVIDATVGTSNGYWDLDIDTGNGWDVVTITDVDIEDDLRVDTAGGSDTIDVNNSVVDDDVSLEGGSDADTIDLNGLDADDVYLYGQGGGDTVNLRYVDVNDYLYARLGSGNDEFNANGSIYFGRATINGDSNHDDFNGWMWGANVTGFEE